MRRSIWILGAVMAVILGVGCGPMDPEELSGQGQDLKATPILMGTCPAMNACGTSFGSCSEWSAPAGCGDPSTNTLFQFQQCSDAQGNQCFNVSLSTTPVDGSST